MFACICAFNCVFFKAGQRRGSYPDLRINSWLSLKQENGFRHMGHVLLWVFMMDGAGSLSLWLTASLGFQTTTACQGTDIGLGLPRGFSSKPVSPLSHPLLIPYPLSLSIHLSISPSRPAIHPSQSTNLFHKNPPTPHPTLRCLRSGGASEAITQEGKMWAEREQIWGI